MAYESMEGRKVTIYGFRVKDLDGRWSEWFDRLTTTNLENSEALLSGEMVDQVALHGVTRPLRPS